MCSVYCTVDEALEMHVGSRGNHCLHIFFFLPLRQCGTYGQLVHRKLLTGAF